MDWHHHLLSNHRNDKSKDDNDIYDNDENNVVGPKKDYGMPTTFPKTEHKKHDIKAKLRLFQKLAWGVGRISALEFVILQSSGFERQKRKSPKGSPITKPLLALKSNA